MKKCENYYNGNMKNFLEKYHHNFMKKKQIEIAHAQILDCLSSEHHGGLITRNFKSYSNSGRTYFSSDESNIKFFVGDNEPVVYFWTHLYNEKSIDLAYSIQEKIIPISMAPNSKGGECKKKWKVWGNGDTNSSPNSSWRGISGGRWKLCHIFQAAPKHLGDSTVDIRARFVRNFHPLNHFWFPSEYNWKIGCF
jgi:hypothetical protein